MLLTEEGVHDLAHLRQKALLAHKHIDRNDDANHQIEHAAGKVHRVFQRLGQGAHRKVIRLGDGAFHREVHRVDDLLGQPVHGDELHQEIQHPLERSGVVLQIGEDRSNADQDLRDHQPEEQEQHPAGKEIGQQDRHAAAGRRIDGVVGEPGQKSALEKDIHRVEQIGDDKAEDERLQGDHRRIGEGPQLGDVLQRKIEQDGRRHHQK